MDKKIIGDNIRAARKLKKWTQKDLSEESQIEQTVISQYENGRKLPSLESILKLAKALGTTIDSLCSGGASISSETYKTNPGDEIARALYILRKYEIIDSVENVSSGSFDSIRYQMRGRDTPCLPINCYSDVVRDLLDQLDIYLRSRDTYRNPDAYLEEILHSAAVIINR